MLLQSLTGIFALSAEIASDFLAIGLTYFAGDDWEETSRRGLDKWLNWGLDPKDEE